MVEFLMPVQHGQWVHTLEINLKNLHETILILTILLPVTIKQTHMQFMDN